MQIPPGINGLTFICLVYRMTVMVLLLFEITFELSSPFGKNFRLKPFLDCKCTRGECQHEHDPYYVGIKDKLRNKQNPEQQVQGIAYNKNDILQAVH